MLLLFTIKNLRNLGNLGYKCAKFQPVSCPSSNTRTEFMDLTPCHGRCRWCYPSKWWKHLEWHAIDEDEDPGRLLLKSLYYSSFINGQFMLALDETKAHRTANQSTVSNIVLSSFAATTGACAPPRRPLHGSRAAAPVGDARGATHYAQVLHNTNQQLLFLLSLK